MCKIVLRFYDSVRFGSVDNVVVDSGHLQRFKGHN